MKTADLACHNFIITKKHLFCLNFSAKSDLLSIAHYGYLVFFGGLEGRSWYLLTMSRKTRELHAQQKGQLLKISVLKMGNIIINLGYRTLE